MPQGFEYAKNTSVSVERSRQELETVLRRAGAKKVMLGWDGDTTFFAFMIDGLPVKQAIEMPPKSDFASTETGRQRTESAQNRAWEQACRQRMREHVVLLKAKLVAVSLGFRTMEQEFLADVCLPNGSTVAEHWHEQLMDATRNGKLPALLPGI